MRVCGFKHTSDIPGPCLGPGTRPFIQTLKSITRPCAASISGKIPPHPRYLLRKTSTGQAITGEGVVRIRGIGHPIARRLLPCWVQNARYSSPRIAQPRSCLRRAPFPKVGPSLDVAIPCLDLQTSPPRNSTECPYLFTVLQLYEHY